MDLYLIDEYRFNELASNIGIAFDIISAAGKLSDSLDCEHADTFSGLLIAATDYISNAADIIDHARTIDETWEKTSNEFVAM